MNTVLDKLVKFGEAIGRQRHLNAISSGIMMTVPIMVIGSLFLIAANPPINLDIVDLNTSNIFMRFMIAWKEFTLIHGASIIVPFSMTMGIVGMINAGTIAYSLASSYQLNAHVSSIISTSIFLMVAGMTKDGAIAMEYLGANGVFTAIIIALLSVEIAHFIKEKKIAFSLDESIPPAVIVSINALIPLLANIIILYGFNLFISINFGMNFPAWVMNLLSPVAAVGNNLWGYIAILVFGNFLWFFGINGTAIILPIVLTLGITNTGFNGELVTTGKAPEHIMNLQMFRYYALGGAGNTLGLILLMMKSKVKYLRSIGNMALIPGICSINEPVIFGVPIVLNPIFIIPFMLMPLVSSIMGYFAQSWGWVSLGYMVDPSFTPFFIQAYLSALDWRNIVLMFVIIAVSYFVYQPFFRVFEKQQLK